MVFLDLESALEQKPVGAEKAHNLPVAHPTQGVQGKEGEFFPVAPYVFEPDLVELPFLFVPEKGGHGGFVKLDRDASVYGKLDSFQVAHHPRP